MKPTYGIRVAVALGWLLATGCHKEEETREKLKVSVTTPLRKTTQLNRDYVGQIRAIQHIELRALERGYLQGIFVDEGQAVKAGQKMFQIMPLLYNAEVLKASAEAQRSEIEFNNTRMLADKNVVSPQELALSRANLSTAQAQLQLATTHKGFTEVRAPFDGIMGRFQARLGSLIGEGDLLTTMSDNRTMWVYFNVTESEYLSYKNAKHGDEPEPVLLIMANGQVFNQPGFIQTIEADFNNETGTIAFRAGFPNPEGLLRHGETGKVRMTVPLPDALLVPQKATFEVLEKRYCYVVDEKNTVHSRVITIANELPDLFAVSGGLKETDRILLDGLRKVHENDVVDVEFEKPEEVYSNLDARAE